MHTTGLYFVDHAWRAWKRLNRGCPAALLRPAAAARDDDAAAPASLTRHLTATHDEWQRLRIGAHHWSSVWHKSRFANHPYPRDAVLEDEGLMD